MSVRLILHAFPTNSEARFAMWEFKTANPTCKAFDVQQKILLGNEEHVYRSIQGGPAVFKGVEWDEVHAHRFGGRLLPDWWPEIAALRKRS